MMGAQYTLGKPTGWCEWSVFSLSGGGCLTLPVAASASHNMPKWQCQDCRSEAGTQTE